MVKQAAYDSDINAVRRVQRLLLIAMGSLQHPDIDARQHNYSNVDITQVCKIHDSD